MKQRHFDFMVLFWGDRYRGYFVNRCLPCLFAPNNLPLLNADDGHRFLIAAPAVDWHAIKNLPIMDRLRRHTIPTWLEVDEPAAAAPDQKSWNQYKINLDHMGRCLRVLFEAARAGRGYGCSLLPDIMISDGMVASMLKSARAGAHLVLCSSTRQIEEDVVADLSRIGLFRPDASYSLTAEAVTIPQRVATELAIRHMHPEMFAFDEAAPQQHPFPPFRMLRVPGDRGIILHTFISVPVLMDYAVVPADHTACLDRDTFEDSYISANFSHCGGIHIVQDSDEFFILSLTPKTVDWTPSSAARNNVTRLREYRRLCSIRRAFKVHAKDDRIKWELFRTSFRWHTRDLDDVWFAHEHRVDKAIEFAAGDYFGDDQSLRARFRASARWFLFNLLPTVGSFACGLGSSAWRIVTNAPLIAERALLAIRGDPAARRWLAERIRARGRRLMGKS